ncbi:hypothetical protein [Sediminicola sp. YIK13]|uniref:hypothetical protein n=1 Tax=Sediminicola sp. YIK13 TaxID=1453352 RepID=UPI0011A73A0A|nr:hypothetical protein [Sediminicola sp. YIK13]
MKLFIYTLLLFFSIGAVVSEFIHDYKSFKLIKYSCKSDKYFIKEKFYFTHKLPGDNSEGSQGEWVYYGNIKSSGKDGSIRGWIKAMESKWHFDEKLQQYYFNIWYCPDLNIILDIIEGDISDSNNSSFQGWMIQSWFRAIMFIMAVPLTIIVYKIKKSKKNEI